MHAVADQVELASVLSGNRNFEGRISPDVSQNYLAAPATVIAYSLVGTMDFDFETQPLGTDVNGRDVFLADIWPEDGEVQTLLRNTVTKDLFDEGGKGLFDGDARWQSLRRFVQPDVRLGSGFHVCASRHVLRGHEAPGGGA